MYQIEEPIYFYFLAIIPAVMLIFLWVFWWKKKTQRKFSNSRLLERLAPNTSPFKSVLKLAFLLIGLSLLIVSLTNPKMGTKIKTVKREGVDVVFALDVSKSMLAEDIAPNRLEKSKQIISKIIDQLGSDRVGIIIYAGNAYPLLPITTDHAAAKMFLQNANPDMVSSQGTAINEALDLAKTYYNNDEQTNRFLIIISEFGMINPATIKNDAEEKSPGISIFVGFNFLGGETLIIFCLFSYFSLISIPNFSNIFSVWFLVW